MRILFLGLLLVFRATFAVAADDGAFSGKWEVRQIIAGNESAQTCTFSQKGTELMGSCGGEQGAIQISGRVDDKKVSWSFKTEYNGTALTVKYMGTIDAQKKVTGTVTVEPYSVEGEFTATQAQ